MVFQKSVILKNAVSERSCADSNYEIYMKFQPIFFSVHFPVFIYFFFITDESYARKIASQNMGFDDQLYGNEPTISVYSWILFFLLLFLTISFFVYWSRHRVGRP